MRLQSRRGDIVAPVLFASRVPTKPIIVAGVLISTVVALWVFAKEPDAEQPRYPTLGATPIPSDYPLPSRELLPTTKRIAKLIAGNKEHPGEEAAMKPYDLAPERVKKGSLKMIPIKGGEFVFGSEKKGEGPPRKVRIEPFWMAETEVTWAFYDPYFMNHRARNLDGTLLRDRNGRPLAEEELVDIVTQPTPQYWDLWLDGDFVHGPDYPAMCMTQHAASKYCEWLSAQTGHFYRLPTEVEWEYACRAGTTTAYHFGDRSDRLAEYAWFADDTYTYHKVRQRKPNAWGLYDMHGNVAEWVLDGFDPGYRKLLQPGILNPWKIPLTRYPRVAKGGSWDHDPEDLRCAARMPSERGWKDTDPLVPKSIWYAEDAQFVGFRIIRPLQTPSAEEMHLYWNTDWWTPERNREDLE